MLGVYFSPHQRNIYVNTNTKGNLSWNKSKDIYIFTCFWDWRWKILFFHVELKSLSEILSKRSVFPWPLRRSHVHALRNNFLVQIVRSLSEEGRVFFKKKKNYCFNFNRLILLLEWESVAKLVIIFAPLSTIFDFSHFHKHFQKQSLADVLQNRYSKKIRKFWIKKSFQQSCFPVNIAKLLRTDLLQNFSNWLLLHFFKSK